MTGANEKPAGTVRHVTASEARDAVHRGGEIAFLDLREAGPYSQGHPLFATSTPFSTFEADVGALVPRLTVPVLLMDGGDGVADAAGAALVSMGYSDVTVLDGGAPAWAAAGHTLYKGVNVPSKTLGELVEHLWHPATIGPETLHDWQTRGQAFEFFDCRPPAEFAKMTVPGARCLPNGEIAHRLPALPGDTPLVLTCAGRTRGIIGAAGLARVAGGRRIVALENGTQGWRLAGFDLAFGSHPGAYPELDAAGRQATRQAAQSFMADEAIPTVPSDAVAALGADRKRTTYFLDVRSGQEAAADPLPAFRHALSGQLVQATDQWIGVRGARVVLADDLGLRAALAAFWLRTLGFEPCVAQIDDTLRRIAPAPVPHPPAASDPTCAPDTALADHRQGNAVFLDLRMSSAFSAGHVAGARWTIRPHLRHLPTDRRYILIGDDSPRAGLAARELQRLGHVGHTIVEGGHAALRRAGAAIETAPPMPLNQAIDVTSFAHGRHDGDLDASRLYLDWEQGLVAQLDADERAAFRL